MRSLFTKRFCNSSVFHALPSLEQNWRCSSNWSLVQTQANHTAFTSLRLPNLWWRAYSGQLTCIRAHKCKMGIIPTQCILWLCPFQMSVWWWSPLPLVGFLGHSLSSVTHPHIVSVLGCDCQSLHARVYVVTELLCDASSFCRFWWNDTCITDRRYCGVLRTDRTINWAMIPPSGDTTRLS